MNKRFHDLMTRYFLGEVTEEEFKEFEKLIAENENLRREYIEQTMIETDMKSVSMEEQAAPTKLKSFSKYELWLAVALLLLAPLLFWPKSEPALGVISSSESAAWESSQPTLPGAEIRPGKFKLHSGLSTLRFNPGADVIIEAPAIIEVVSDMHVNVLKGAVSVHVFTDDAKGFRVDTPYGHAIDHGTRFTVKVKEDEKAAEFVVQEGEISLHHESGESVWLKKKEASKMSASALSDLASAESEELLVAEKKSVILSCQNREVSVIANDDLNLVSRSRLLTKLQGKFSQMNRRALFAFKLSEVDLENVDSILLSLNYIRNGSAIELPDVSEFELYGINDEQDISTIKKGAKWAEVPQIEQAVFLEKFSIPRSKKTQKLIFDSQEIFNYIKSSKDVFVGFIIVCNTKTKGLHYTFASSLDKEYSGPQLELIAK